MFWRRKVEGLESRLAALEMKARHDAEDKMRESADLYGYRDYPKFVGEGKVVKSVFIYGVPSLCYVVVPKEPSPKSGVVKLYNNNEGATTDV